MCVCVCHSVHDCMCENVCVQEQVAAGWLNCQIGRYGYLSVVELMRTRISWKVLLLRTSNYYCAPKPAPKAKTQLSVRAACSPKLPRYRRVTVFYDPQLNICIRPLAALGQN